jgi:hypothetical protein
VCSCVLNAVSSTSFYHHVTFRGVSERTTEEGQLPLELSEALKTGRDRDHRSQLVHFVGNVLIPGLRPTDARNLPILVLLARVTFQGCSPEGPWTLKDQRTTGPTGQRHKGSKGLKAIESNGEDQRAKGPQDLREVSISPSTRNIGNRLWASAIGSCFATKALATVGQRLATVWANTHSLVCELCPDRVQCGRDARAPSKGVEVCGHDK